MHSETRLSTIIDRHYHLKNIAMPKFFDEMYADAVNGKVRGHYREFEAWLAEQSPETIAHKRAEADLIFRRVGITFGSTATTRARNG